MKVQGPGKTQGPSKTKKSSSASEIDGKFGEFMTGGVAKAASTAATHSIAQVDSLLAIQGAEDPTERSARQKAQKRCKTILDELEKIRLAMLSGNLTVGHMVDVADVVSAHRQKITDPALVAIMDEVDLRAQVELAKMRMVMDRKSAG